MHRSHRQAQLSYYTFKYDRRKGRRQLGVRPTEMAHLLPEAFSTFTLPVVLPNGSRSSVEGVPNVDWTYLFAHTVTVTQARLMCMTPTPGTVSKTDYDNFLSWYLSSLLLACHVSYPTMCSTNSAAGHPQLYLEKIVGLPVPRRTLHISRFTHRDNQDSRLSI